MLYRNVRFVLFMKTLSVWETICDAGLAEVRFCAQSTKFTLFLVNQEYPPLRLALLIEDLKSLGLKLSRIPPENENWSGLWIWVSQEYPLPKMKIGQDFGFELAKNNSPSPLKIKIGQEFRFELAKITPPHQKSKLVRTLDLNFTRIPPKWKLVRTLDLNLPRIPLWSENGSGLWVWTSQEHPPLPCRTYV